LKSLFTILSFLFFLSGSSQTLVGYLKNSGSFLNTDGLNISPCNVAAYISGRNFGNVGIGDIITNVSGVPINGGSTWWGYSRTNGGTSLYRAFKIDGTGAVVGIVVPPATIGGNPNPNRMIPVSYHNNSGVLDCSGTGFTFPIYGPADDPGIYENAPRYNSDGSGLFTNGTLFTASPALNGSAFTTFTYSTTNARATSVACCTPNSPYVTAGADQITDMSATQIPLSGIAFDCGGNIASYSWSRISGPNTPTINDNTAAVTFITGFAVGTYVYRLTVTDNTGHSSSDDVSITVVASFVGTPLPIVIEPYKIWSFAADMTRGAEGFIGDTSNAAVPLVGHKNGAWLGDAYGFFDNNPATYPRIQRDFTTLYYRGGNGTQRCLWINLGRKYDFYSVKWRDLGNVNLSNVAELIIGSLEDTRKGLFEFDNHLAYGAPTILYNFNQVVTNGLYSYPYIRASGQFILIRLNDVAGAGGIAHSGPGFSDFMFEGLPSADSAKDNRITFDFSIPLVRDTTVRRGDAKGFAEAAGWESAGNFVQDSILKAPKTSSAGIPTFNWMGSYLHVFASAGNPTNGVMDRATTRPARGAIKVNLNPYNPCTSCTPSLFFDSSRFIRPNIKSYNVLIQPNERLLAATGFASLEHVPIDSVGADFRQDSSYDMFSETFVKLAAKEGPEVPNFTRGFGTMISAADYESDDFPNRYGIGRITVLVPGNEMNVGFRNGSIANSNYMDPFALRAFHDKLYREWHLVFNGPFYSMGMAAWKVRSFMEAQMLNNIKYLDMDHPLADVWNIHVVCESDMVRTTEPGVVDALGSHAEFGGWRNEGLKTQTLLDTVAYMMHGKYPKVAFSEIAISTNQLYATRRDSAGTDASMSTHGARPIYSSIDGHQYSPYESQGFLMTNIWTHQDAVQGLVFSTHYEFEDAADTSACNTGIPCTSGCPVGTFCDDDGFCKFRCFNNSDANDGVRNRFGNHTHGGIPHFPFFKGSYFVTQFDQIEKGDYRVVWKRADSISGLLHYLYRNVFIRNKFLSFVQWQDSTKPATDRQIPLWSDVTTCTNKIPAMYDWTFSGTNDVNTLSAGVLTFRPKPEGNYIDFASDGLAAFLDSTPPSSPSSSLPIYLPIHRKKALSP
jgi:hypothetical protein